MTRVQGKHWTFTINNWTDQDETDLKDLFEAGEVAYLVWGREVGESGTPHLQGFISLKTRKDKRWVIDRIHGHIERRLENSTNAKAANYCKKDGDFDEFGVLPPEKGSRSDLKRTANDVVCGKRIRDIARDDPGTYCLFYKGLRELRRELDEPRRWVTTNFIYYGETGTGKSETVWKNADPHELWTYPGGGWFDSYDGQSTVLFDDFAGHELSVTMFLKITDRYPMLVRVKGGFVNWRPRVIYFTSNKHPRDWWQNVSAEHMEAVMRRCHIIREFTK